MGPYDLPHGSGKGDGGHTGAISTKEDKNDRNDEDQNANSYGDTTTRNADTFSVTKDAISSGTNIGKRVTDEREEASTASQVNPAENAPTKPARAKGKQRRVRKGSSHVASEDDDDPESTDSDGVQPRSAKKQTSAAPQAEILRIVEVDRPAQATVEEAPAAGEDDYARSGKSHRGLDVVDLHKAVAHLTEAVAEMRKECQSMPARDATATPPVEQSATQPSERKLLHDSRGSRQQLRTTATRTAGRPQHGTERGRSPQQHQREQRRGSSPQGYQVNEWSSDESFGVLDAVGSERKRLSKPQRRRMTVRRQRAVRRDSLSSSSSDDFDESSTDGQRRRSVPRRTYQRVRRQQPDSNGDDFGSDGSDDDDDDESSEVDSERSRSESRGSQCRRERSQRRGRRVRRERREQHGRERSTSALRGVPRKPGNIKNLELPVFTPAPGVSAVTWVDRVDLTLQGARASGQGEWSYHALYFILGNKLMESAAMWWVTMNRRLTRRQRMWTHLKKELLKRFGPRKNKAAAEWRVNNRTMLNGESYDDFAAGLRQAADRNRVNERVLLAQYYRNLDKTTRQLVKMEPRPRTLEEAVAKTNRIDDPADNIAQGMKNIGQAFPMTVGDDNGQTVVITGVGGMSLPAELTEAVVNSTATEPANKDAVTVFTNQ